MNDFMPEGNFDSEGLGGIPSAQSFPGANNIQTPDTDFNGSRSSKMSYYEQLGNALLKAFQQQSQPQQQQQQQPAGMNYNQNLTSGFDQNWLMNQTNAGSANGAKI